MKKYTKTGMSLIGANVMVGSIPNITGSATESNLKENFTGGVSNVGKMLPTYGKIKGAEMIIKPIRKLKKKGSKLMKGGKF